MYGVWLVGSLSLPDRGSADASSASTIHLFKASPTRLPHGPGDESMLHHFIRLLGLLACYDSSPRLKGVARQA